MSYVTDLFVFASVRYDEDRFEKAVNEAYNDVRGPILKVMRPDFPYGGNKALQAVVLAGAVNYLHMDRLGAALRYAAEVAWEDHDDGPPGFVQVVWQSERGDGFNLVTLQGSDLHYGPGIIEDDEGKNELVSAWTEANERLAELPEGFRFGPLALQEGGDDGEGR